MFSSLKFSLKRTRVNISLHELSKLKHQDNFPSLNFSLVVTSSWFIFFFPLIIWEDLYVVCLSYYTSMSRCPWFLAHEANIPSPQVSSDIITKRYFTLALLWKRSLLIFSLGWKSGLLLQCFLCFFQGIL